MNIQNEAEKRYPINEHTGEVPFYAKLRRGAFTEGAEWARREAFREAADIAHMIHYAAECSTDGILSPRMQSRSNTAFEIRDAIRNLAKDN